jgi:hypothetical protein
MQKSASESWCLALLYVKKLNYIFLILYINFLHKITLCDVIKLTTPKFGRK